MCLKALKTAKDQHCIIKKAQGGFSKGNLAILQMLYIMHQIHAQE